MNTELMTIRKYRLILGWSVYKLSKEAGVSYAAAKKAEDGLPVAAHVAKAIADTLSKHLERDIKPWEIEGLNIQ